MKKILVPVDFSDCSMDALRTATDIARITQAEIILAHWYIRPIIGVVDARVDTKENEEYKEEINRLIVELSKKDFMEGIKTAKLVLKDKDANDLMHSEHAKNADLIVMGTKGASDLKEMFMGSNAQKIVRNAVCPVLAIKEYMDLTKVTDVIFASDFNKDENVDAYKKLVPLFDMMKAHLHLLKVITPSYFEDTDVTEAKMYQFKKNAGIDDCTSMIYNNYSPEEGITEYAGRFDSSLISIATKGLKGFSHFMSGSISEDLVNRLNKPILTIKM